MQSFLQPAVSALARCIVLSSSNTETLAFFGFLRDRSCTRGNHGIRSH
jgi:hypothetical protein